jgi:hypothetical protein
MASAGPSFTEANASTITAGLKTLENPWIKTIPEDLEPFLLELDTQLYIAGKTGEDKPTPSFLAAELLWARYLRFKARAPTATAFDKAKAASAMADYSLSKAKADTDAAVASGNPVKITVARKVEAAANTYMRTCIKAMAQAYEATYGV